MGHDSLFYSVYFIQGVATDGGKNTEHVSGLALPLNSSVTKGKSFMCLGLGFLSVRQESGELTGYWLVFS